MFLLQFGLKCSRHFVNLNPHFAKKQELTMKVRLKCFSTMVNADSCDFKKSTTYDLEDGHTVEDLVQHAGIDRKAVKVAFVNSRIMVHGAGPNPSGILFWRFMH